MIQQVNAIFDHGVLRPLGPIDLQDQEQVVLSIEKVSQEKSAEQAERTLFEVLDEAGLVGCIDDLPADLSSNPKYMEGFGKSDR